jgi:hypothetical protein
MLISLLVALIVLAIIFWLFTTYLLPRIPAPWGTVILVILVIITIVFLANRFLGLSL